MSRRRLLISLSVVFLGIAAAITVANAAPYRSLLGPESGYASVQALVRSRGRPEPLSWEQAGQAAVQKRELSPDMADTGESLDLAFAVQGDQADDGEIGDYAVRIIGPPEPPAVTIAISNTADVELSWPHVITDVYGNPVTVVEYLVYRSTAPYFAPTIPWQIVGGGRSAIPSSTWMSAPSATPTSTTTTW